MKRATLGTKRTSASLPRTLARALRERVGAPAARLASLLDALDRERYARGARRLPSARWRREFTLEARALQRSLGDVPR